jgi:hypothetical protein
MRLRIPRGPLFGVTLHVGDPQPLPLDVARWRRQVVCGEHSLETIVEVRDTVEAETETGWPVVLVSVDVIRRANGAVVERRLFAFYQLVDMGVTATAIAEDEAALALVRALLVQGDVDWDSDELVALAQLWHDEG